MAELRNSEFENSFKLTKISLFLSGINLSMKRSFPLNFIFILNLIWLFTDVFGEFYWVFEGVRAGKSFEELSVILPCTVICFLAAFRCVPLYLNNKLLAKIFNKLCEIHPKAEDKENNTEKEEKEITGRAVKLFHNIITFMVIANSSVVIAFCLLPLILMAIDYQKTGEVDLKLPFLVKYFFDPFTMTKWPLVYLHHIWSTFIVVLYLFGADTFFHACCIYLRMHFELLCSRFEKVVTNSKKGTEERLRACILRHQELIALVELMEQLYSKSFLFNIMLSSILICLSGFNIVFSKQFGQIFAYVNFLVMCLYQIFMICYFGDMVVISSSQVGEAIFNSKWYNAEVKIKKSLYIVLLRSQKPCTLTAAKFATMNLRAFTTILSRSWSYFALLRTMYN